MRSVPSALAVHLASGATSMCNCWKLTTRGGEVLGFTDHDRELQFDGVAFEPESGFTASEMEATLGFAVNNQDVTGALRSDRLDAERIVAGDFDGAAIEVWWVNWQSPSQRLLERAGTIGEISRGGLGLTAEVRGLTAQFDQPRGRIFQFGCDAILGSPRCGVNLDDVQFVGPGTVTAAFANRQIAVSGLAAFADGWFARGTLTWTSGGNLGRVIEIKSHRALASSVSIELWHEPPFAIAAGNTFQARAGCDKQFSTCRGKFSNQANFRGFPHMPGDDFILSYPRQDDARKSGETLD